MNERATAMTTAIAPCAGTGTTTTKPAAAHACCTELECFEKPRFFCGQLLTDVDLEAATSYVVAKNRLHNRYLFGAGVVCGLAVRCDPCNSGSVVVESGYALDCSGNDVIVCADTPFDVKGHLDRRRKEKQADCSKGKTYIPDDCEGMQREYCLVLSYEEKPGKPVNALVRDNGCRSNRCEPSRTLERFRFDLVDKKTAEKLNVRPSAFSRMNECIREESAKLAAYRGEVSRISNPQQQQLVYSRLRSDLIAFAKRSGLTHCDLIEKICAIDVRQSTLQSIPTAPGTTPNPTGTPTDTTTHPATTPIDTTTHPAEPATGTTTTAPSTTPATTAPPVDAFAPIVSPRREGVIPPAIFSTGSPGPSAVDELIVLYNRLIADCACNALLVPCAPCCDDSDYVLLACLTLDDKGRVVSICNTVRTQVVTGPAMRYWMQPVFDGVGRFFESMCCPDPLEVPRPQSDPGLMFNELDSAARTASSFAASFVRRSATDASGTIARSLSLVQRPLSEVREQLDRAGVQNVTVTRAATLEDAFRVENLKDFSWEIPAGSRVELVVAPDDTVAAIRVLKGTNP